MCSACKTIGLIRQQSTAAEIFAAGTVVKNQSHFVWMRMPKIKPLHALYRLITDTELCFSAEVNWDNREEISPDVPILNWLLPKKISESKD